MNNRNPDDKLRLLLDTDANNEIDDQHAIAYVLLNGGCFYVEGLTVNRTNNGGDIEAQAIEAERVIALCGLQGVLPVTRGASASFVEIEPHLMEPDFDGVDAVNLIVRRARQASSEKLVLLAIGKLTNIALALKKDPTIIDRVKVVWLGSNYPQPGEYNLDNDPESVNFVLGTSVEFEMAVVRYGAFSGTGAVKVSLQWVRDRIAGKGPTASAAVIGRHGGEFMNFGDYALNLLEHTDLYGDPPARALYDLAAAAIVKQPSWAQAHSIPAPILQHGRWQSRPENTREIVIREYFDAKAILEDFFATMDSYVLADIARE